MESSYKIVIKIGRYFVATWLSISRRRGVFLAKSLNGSYRVMLDVSKGRNDDT